MATSRERSPAANCDALGCFRAANHGTLFLDEIGELDYPLQAKLLRVLQEHVVTPVGSHQGQPVNVRVVAATNRILRTDVLEGRFREDLYYRLDVVHLRTTALRDRPDDICTLAIAFLKQLADEGLPACCLSEEASAVLVDFHWPGNVRQLRNVLEQATIDSHNRILSADLLCRIISLSFASDRQANDEVTADQSSHYAAASRELIVSRGTEWETLEQLERGHISRTLAHTFNNRSAAARLLGVTRQSLLRKMKRYQLDDSGKAVR